MNPCNNDIYSLQDKNVMNSATTPSFALNQNLLGFCQSTGMDYFPLFCLYPPSQDNLLSICNNASTVNPDYLFAQMLDSQLTSVSDLPLIIRYKNLPQNQNWVTQTSVNPIVGSNVVLDESATGNAEWFTGTTTVALANIPLPYDPNTTLVLSQHSLLRAILPSTGTQLVTQFANVAYIMTADTSRIVLLYDCGNIRVYENEAALQDGIVLWESFTNDGYNSDSNFNRLQLPLVAVAAGTLGSVSSPNSQYMLVIYSSHVDLVFNAFNNPRFTTATLERKNLQDAISAQSAFCFQALNIASPPRNLHFADVRCTCAVGDRLTWRVYAHTAFDALPLVTQRLLEQQTPCLMRNCQLEQSEFSNVAHYLSQRCLTSNGICATILPPGIERFLIAQDCTNGAHQCTTSNDCPFGSSCRNGQCISQCSSDIICARANPLATCINGECIVLNRPKNTPMWQIFLLVILAIGLLVFLFLCVYYGVRFSHSRKS